jgi:large subunit ribosomal protein L31
MPKTSIHPNYVLSTITCACSATYETVSTRGSFHVEICAACHPFYTGKQKLLDAAGRIERFQKRYNRKAPTPKAGPEATTAATTAATTGAASETKAD